MISNPGTIIRGCPLHSAEQFSDQGLIPAPDDGLMSFTVEVDVKHHALALQMVDASGIQMRLLLDGESGKAFARMVLMAASDLERQEVRH